MCQTLIYNLQSQMLLTVNLGNCIIFEKYLRMNNLGGLAAEDNLFQLLQRVKVEAPREDPFTYFFQINIFGRSSGFSSADLLSTNYF